MQDIKDKVAVNKAKRLRRKTIPDECITLEQYKNITFKICDSIMQDDIELSQKNVINKAIKYNLSNNMIASIVNYLLPNSKATAGSIASMLRFIKNQKELQREQR